MAFIDTIKEKAKKDKKTIILPESMDRRTFEAAAQILEEDFADLIIIGTPEEIEENSKGLDISKPGSSILIHMRRHRSTSICLLNSARQRA